MPQRITDTLCFDSTVFCLILNPVFKHSLELTVGSTLSYAEIISHAVFDHLSQFGRRGYGLWGSEVTAVVAKWAQLTKLSSLSSGINGHVRHHTKGQK